MATTEVVATAGLKEARQLVLNDAPMKDILNSLGEGKPVKAFVGRLPKLPVVTDEQRAALKELLDVYGQVAPTERRKLSEQEKVSLVKERKVLDIVKAMVEKRVEDQKTIVHNHLDAEAEADGRADDNTPRHPEKGFYLLVGEVEAPEQPKKFSRSTRGGSASLSVQDLQNLEAFGTITHEDFLAMTSQVRVVDEHKLRIWMRSRPDKLADIQSAVTYTGRTAAINFPNA